MMKTLAEILLLLSALYCGLMWLILCVQMWRTGIDRETITYRLGLCFVLSLGFLGLMQSGV